jgi:hypothetical protein
LQAEAAATRATVENRAALPQIGFRFVEITLETSGG